MARHRDTFIGTLRTAARRIENGDTLPAGLVVAILKRLTQLEVAEGGPYALEARTPDVATNLAIARFLDAYDVHLPNLDDFLRKAVSKNPENRRVYDALCMQRVHPLAAESSRDSCAEETRILERIHEAALARFAPLPVELRADASNILERTIAGNGDKQMTLMAYFLRKALGMRGTCFDDESIAQFGLANIFFWAAFIAYDDFWDEDESAEPRFLPVANLFARHYVDFFSSRFPGRSGFRTFFHDLMDKLDGANAWEIAHCRLQRDGSRILMPRQLPDYGDFSIKFYPAAGHMLGALSMFAELGSGPGSRDFEHLTDYFKHYLVAMQINDDAHDWKEDLARGHVSTAVYRLLAVWQAEHPRSASLDVEADMPELERLFWFRVVEPLCESTLAHAGRSRDALAQVSLIEDSAPLDQFILRSERAALRALEDQRISAGLVQAFVLPSENL